MKAKEKRHTCVRCGRKRYESEMRIKEKRYRIYLYKVTNGYSWVCKDFCTHNKIVHLPDANRT